ncbi:MAG: transcriptional regulator [Phenylobacterium sp. RIFCSPHIGHO2_01_FULL_70_10]|nr:MAG: transcriptional regulator [Phenylobacterium sp. RIFCSPHIGHO2_01_FULL_70_10]
MTEEAPNPVDVHVGRRGRLRRKELGVSQAWLADRLGLTFQQVQKYERGANRISASKLYQIASVLEVPITYFFEGLDDPAAPKGARYAHAFTGVVEELLSQPNGPELAEAFLSIRRRSVRRGLAELARAIAANDTDGSSGEGHEAAE